MTGKAISSKLLFKTASTQQCLALAEEHDLFPTTPQRPTRAEAHTAPDVPTTPQGPTRAEAHTAPDVPTTPQRHTRAEAHTAPDVPTTPQRHTRAEAHTAPDVQFCRYGAISNSRTSHAISSDHSFIQFEFEPLGEYRMTSKESAYPTKPPTILKNFRNTNWFLFMRTFLSELRKLSTEYIGDAATGDKRPGGPRKKRTVSKEMEDLIRIINAASLARIPRGRRRQWAPLWTDEMDKAFEAFHLLKANLQSGDCSEMLVKAEAFRTAA